LGEYYYAVALELAMLQAAELGCGLVVEGSAPDA